VKATTFIGKALVIVGRVLVLVGFTLFAWFVLSHMFAGLGSIAKISEFFGTAQKLVRVAFGVLIFVLLVIFGVAAVIWLTSLRQRKAATGDGVLTFLGKRKR